MKRQTTPFNLLESTIRTHLTGKQADVDAATMRAIRAPLARIFRDEGFAHELTRHTMRHQVYVRVIVALVGPHFGGPSDAPATESL